MVHSGEYCGKINFVDTEVLLSHLKTTARLYEMMYTRLFPCNMMKILLCIQYVLISAPCVIFANLLVRGKIFRKSRESVSGQTFSKVPMLRVMEFSTNKNKKSIPANISLVMQS